MDCKILHIRADSDSKKLFSVLLAVASVWLPQSVNGLCASPYFTGLFGTSKAICKEKGLSFHQVELIM